MPKSNRAFWEKKFSENTERDRRVFETLTRQGWKVIVVWECDLSKKTVETIANVARELQENAGAQPMVRYRQTDLKRDNLLKVAEDKIRYRINSYGGEND